MYISYILQRKEKRHTPHHSASSSKYAGHETFTIIQGNPKTNL
jgi:hypothetical protein